MTAKDQLKLLKAGFIIIRPATYNRQIKMKTKEKPEWHTFEKGFKTRKDLEDRVDALLTIRNIVQD